MLDWQCRCDSDWSGAEDNLVQSHFRISSIGDFGGPIAKWKTWE